MNLAIKRVCDRYDAKWRVFNSVLYKMCESMPSHDDARNVRAKVIVIARAYATGLERHVTGGLPVVAVDVVNVLVRSATWLDRDLAAFASRRGGDVPRLDLLRDITSIHGRLSTKLQSVTRDGHSVRSFVSKYLHFHVPVFPIYDANACAELCSRRVMPWQRSWSVEHPFKKGGDPEYWQFCVRMGKLAESWKTGPVMPTARNLDVWLTYDP